MKTISGTEDLDLIERIRRGETDGAAELFQRYAPALLRTTAGWRSW